MGRGVICCNGKERGKCVIIKQLAGFITVRRTYSFIIHVIPFGYGNKIQFYLSAIFDNIHKVNAAFVEN